MGPVMGGGLFKGGAFSREASFHGRAFFFKRGMVQGSAFLVCENDEIAFVEIQAAQCIRDPLAH